MISCFGAIIGDRFDGESMQIKSLYGMYDTLNEIQSKLSP